VTAGGRDGPARLFELKGPVAPGRIAARARNAADASRLWGLSSTLADARVPE